MIRRHYRIGVFDSGIGGLELLYQLRRLAPAEDIYYFADTVNLPYGERPAHEIERFLAEIVEGMLLRRVKLLVIACNTASAVYLSLPDSHPLRRRLASAGVDVVPMTTTEAVADLHALAPVRVAVVGTRLTIESGIYQDLVRELLPDAEVLGLPAPGWVTRVEQPDPDAEIEAALRDAAVREVLAPILDDPPGALVLACTHFPRLTAAIRKVVGDALPIINPAPALAHFVRNYLLVRDLLANEPSQHASNTLLFTNGDPQAITAQLKQMGFDGDLAVRHVDIRSDFSGKVVDVVGYGATGRSLVRYLADKQPARLRVRDKSPDVAGRLAVDFPALAVEAIVGADYLSDLSSADVVFRSPGIAADLPPFVAVRKRGVPIMSDIELFLKHAPGRVVAISGTNGKTTTTLLTQKLFAAQPGTKSVLVGNVGRPVLDDLPTLTTDHVAAVELSSFQLEELNVLPAKAAILLNITPDHLDRHGDMAGYARAKGRLFTLLAPDAFAIYNIDSEDVVNRVLPQGCQARLVPFSTRRVLTLGACRDGDDLLFRYPGRADFRIEGFWAARRFRGEHNLENLLAAALSAWLLGVDEPVIEQVVRDFAGVRYRIELFYRLNGAEVFDDSKGTNPDATIQALATLAGPIHWVAGGVNKGADLAEVAAACRGKVVSALLFGPIAAELSAALVANAPDIPVRLAEDLETAASMAVEAAQPGEQILFSPACASPPGEKYYQRGDRFKAAIARLGPNELSELGALIDDPLATGH